ncbi:MAG: hypothetical protein ACF8GE_11015 [Phycisphaerales bacterium JB043]
MSTSYGALCSDFYVNLKVGLKLDLPDDRQSVLDLFDRIKRQHPALKHLKRFRGEFALESNDSNGRNQWMALRRNTIRAGIVNPPELGDAYTMHRSILEVAPFFLSLSSLDIDYVEMLFGFDLECDTNQNAIVHDAFYAGTPLGELLDIPSTKPMDLQPFLGVGLREDMELQAYFEIKTRTGARQIRNGEPTEEPISVYLTIRKYSPVEDVKDLPDALSAMGVEAERLTESKVIPQLVMPLRESIAKAKF